jgi:hypothetical protein
MEVHCCLCMDEDDMRSGIRSGWALAGTDEVLLGDDERCGLVEG